MGIDIDNKHAKTAVKKTTNSHDPYLRILVKLYAFLARRTDSKFNELVHKRLCFTRTSRPPVSLRRVVMAANGKKEDTIIVVVGTVLDDSRLGDIPKVNVCALHFSRGAKARILAAGGTVLTLDQLAVQRPTGANTVLLRGPRKARKVYKYFGAAGVPGSHVRPKVRSKGRKFERAKGLR